MLKFIFFTILLMSLAGAAVTAVLLAVSHFAGARLTYGARYYLGAAALAAMLLPLWAPNLPVRDNGGAEVLYAETETRTEAPDTARAGNGIPAAERAGAAKNAPVQSEETRSNAQNESDAEYSVSNYETMRLEELFREFENSAFPIRASKSELYITVLALLWLFGAAVCAVRYVIGAVWFRVKIFCFSHPAPASKRGLLEELCREFGIRRKIKLRVFMGDMSPFITGMLFNTVYVPHNADDETLRLVLRHELVHCKRFDLLYKGLLELAAAVHFFNPFVYLLKRYVNKFCELSCDEAAVEALSGAERRRYCASMLTIIKKSRYRLRGAAALGERKSNLKERVEFIMKNKKYSRKCRLASRAAVAVSLAASLVLGVIAQAQNTAEMPQTSYADDDVAVSMYLEQSVESDEGSVGLALMCNQGAAVFSDVLGFTRFYASWTAEPVSKIREDRDFIAANGREAYLESEIGSEREMSDFYELNLTSVVDRWSYITESMECRARLLRNGEAVAEDLPIYITCVPNSGSFRYMTYSTSVNIPNVTIDGEVFEINLSPRFLEVDTDDRIEYQSVDYNFNRSRETREVYISEIEELTADGHTYTDRPCEFEIKYNPKSQNAEMYVAAYDEVTEEGFENYTGINLNLSNYRSAKVTENSITADFAVITPDNYNAQPYAEKPYVRQLTVTGLDGSAGDAVEVSSDDGSVYARLIIGTAPEEKTRLKGTREVSEFIVEGEDYFVGTPAEQADFDRDEHSKYYKRIVVDDEGKVIYVIPIELQQTAALNEAVDKMHGGDTSYSTAMHYESLVDNVRRGMTAILIDSLTWWPKAILTEENCFAAPDDEMPIGADVVISLN